MAISHSTFPPFHLSASHRGQALMELAAGMFALALVVVALCGFALYMAKSLEVQNKMRVGGKTSDSVEVSSFGVEHGVFREKTLRIDERLSWPQTTILR